MARHASRKTGIGFLLVAMLLAGHQWAVAGGEPQAPLVKRSFAPFSQGEWIGNAVSYGPHRDGQRPGGPDPSEAEIREDLHLMQPHWRLLRVYGAGSVTETMLQVIRDDGLDMKVMLGAWIAADAPAANKEQVDAAIRLANAFPEIVIAVSVGNETQVYWSAHRSPLSSLIGHVRRIRAAVSVPVTSADDFAFWILPESRELAQELDFITVHAHPLWNGFQLGEALPWLKSTLADIRKIHPDDSLVLGEAGWATDTSDQGEQGRLIKGRAGEAEQKIFYDQIRAWADTSRTAVFFFEAFDENWKGSDDPREVEKHWGVFRADRSAKQALTENP